MGSFQKKNIISFSSGIVSGITVSDVGRSIENKEDSFIVCYCVLNKEDSFILIELEYHFCRIQGDR